MLSRIESVGIFGLDTFRVTIEVNISSRGFPGFDIVGLPGKVVAESKNRIKTAITNSGLNFPSGKRVIVNLSPADIPKNDSSYDLAIAVGILCLTHDLKIPDGSVFSGELSLSGEAMPSKGMLLRLLHSADSKYNYAFFPSGNLLQVGGFLNLQIVPVISLEDLCHSLSQGKITPLNYDSHMDPYFTERAYEPVGIIGQEQAVRASLICAAGMHNLLFMGPPGVGKTFISRNISQMIPPLSREESVEVTKIHSYSHSLNALVTERPFRSPHSSITLKGLIGGGYPPEPGEITYAHRGFLFLDEIHNYSKECLEALKTPAESGEIQLARNRYNITFPSRFTLVAACNPCPCGYKFSKQKKCTCTPSRILSYKLKLSQALISRFDLFITLNSISDNTDEFSFNKEKYENPRKLIDSVFEIQTKRYAGTQIRFNSQLNEKGIREFCHIETSLVDKVHRYIYLNNLSYRSFFSCLRVARTVADLEGKEEIGEAHVMEALQYIYVPNW